MTHTGSCTKDCGHMLDSGHTRHTELAQRTLDRDPRVVEYNEIAGGWLEFLYARDRRVTTLHLVAARAAGIGELQGRDVQVEYDNRRGEV